MTLKEKIIDRINSIEDKEALKEILRLVSIEPKIENEKMYEFDEWEMQQVKEGMDDIKYGRTYTQEEASKLISEWLKEKSSGL